jgi:hypothetical protein
MIENNNKRPTLLIRIFFLHEDKQGESRRRRRRTILYIRYQSALIGLFRPRLMASSKDFKVVFVHLVYNSA